MLILHAALYCRDGANKVSPSVRHCYCPFSFSPYSKREREKVNKSIKGFSLLSFNFRNQVKKDPLKVIFILTMHILASDFFEKDDKYVFKVRNSCCV